MTKLETFAAKAEEKAAAERREIQALNAKVKNLTTERDRLLRQLGVIESLGSGKAKPPNWLSPKSPAKAHRATLCLLLTDTHFDETVDPGEMHGINAYNREIAELRLERCFRSTVKLARHYLAGVQYDGVSLFLGGDIFSGNIHEELARTNVSTLFEGLLHWLGPMAAGIEMLKREFGRVHVSGVPGNHGRMTRKPIMKQRAADNLDWLFYHLLEREFRNDDRVTWDIPTAHGVHVKVYETRYYMEHGDNFSGGSGISGALAPLMLGTHRTGKLYNAAGMPYDWMVLGHWHTEMFHKGLIVGPTLKGLDEYAMNKLKATPEPPAQLLWITTPENGIGWRTQVLVGDRKAEGW